MKAANRRLDKVEAALLPKQQVLRWLDHAFSFGTEEEYFAWQMKQPPDDRPRVGIPRKVEASVRAAMRGEPANIVDRAVNQAVRDVFFLTQLVIDANLLVHERCRELELRVALGARGLQLLEVHTAVRGAGLAGNLGNRNYRAAAVQGEIEALVRDSEVLEKAVEAIRRRYFDGHSILFHGTAGHLARVEHLTQALVAEYDGLSQGRGESVRRSPSSSAPDTDVGGVSPGLPVLDPDTVRRDARAEGVALARYRAYLAKAHVLWDLGRLAAGDAVFRNIA
jgi:hypothetical protein